MPLARNVHDLGTNYKGRVLILNWDKVENIGVLYYSRTILD